MTDIVIVGKAYYSDLRPDQGLPPGLPGFPSHPWVPPSGSPGRPDQGLPPFATQLPIIIPGAPPGAPGSPSHPIYLPVYPDQGLPPGGSAGSPSHPWVPPGQPGQPTHPIYHPGHPDHGLPAFPSHPIELPPGGTPIDPPAEIPPPPGHEDEVVVGVYKPNQGWQFSAYDIAPDQGQPAPSPH